MTSSTAASIALYWGISSRRAKFYSSVLYAILTGHLARPALFSGHVITQQRSVQHIFSPPSRRSTLRALLRVFSRRDASLKIALHYQNHPPVNGSARYCRIPAVRPLPV